MMDDALISEFFESYPKERVGSLHTTLLLKATSLTQSIGWDISDLLNTRFFAGYLLGFPSYLDDVDQKYGAVMRRSLFISVYGTVDADAISQGAMKYSDQGDFDVRIGLSAGEDDGQFFWRSLEIGGNVDGCTERLENAFEGGIVAKSMPL